MDEEEAQELVARRMGGKVIKPPRRARLWAWIVEVVHPLLHHKVLLVQIGANNAINEVGFVCRLCGKPM
jgi:hypothetical protein